MPFVQNAWYVAGWSNEVGKEAPWGRVIAGRPIVFYRGEDGSVVALEDRCSHRCAPLSKGRVEGDAVRCWYHGLLFGNNGACLEMPGQDRVPSGFGIHAYPAVEKEGWIWVWLGSAAAADEALIPACGLDEGGIDYRTGHLDYAANYELINDNLCDLSHVAYVHEQTLARDATDWVQREATYTNIDNGVGVARWIPGSQPLPLPGLPERVDIRSSYSFYVPGAMSLLIAYYPVGTAAAVEYGEPHDAPLFALRNVHGITPTDEKSSRYHFGVSLPVNPCPPEALDAAIAMVTFAFGEDKQTIEDQQRALDLFPDVVLRNTVHDTALMRIRRLIANQIKRETTISSEV
ncbi:Rieske 2Fe-2S domain-containing protein [Novosphingobium sp.]|uniref:Rieske 2Fe-2S domain-containing protein n=1 Tax=Novosphingobium sp. TaxID=1874826 RepID=UPI0035B42027